MSTVQLLQLPAAEQRRWLDSFDTVLCDCDGVLWLHDTAIGGSAAVVRLLQQHGKRVFLVTNNSSRTRAEFAAKAARLEFAVRPDQIVSTAHVAAAYLRRQLAADRSVYVIGSAGLCKELTALGVPYCGGCGPDATAALPSPLQSLADGDFVPDPRVGAVIVGFDEHFSFAKLSKAAAYLAGGPERCLFVATSIDQRSPVRSAVIPGTGALLRAVEEVAGRRAQPILGKPDATVLQALMEEHGIERGDRRVLMIGDRCNTDVALGARCGFQTLLVGSGVHGLADAAAASDREQVPDWFVPQLGDLEPFFGSATETN